MSFSKPLRTVLAALAVATVFSVTASAQGRVDVIGGDTYDWGNVVPGELQAVIEIKNGGDSVLKIDRVQPGCGCTTSPIDKSVLAPGEVGKISVKLDARNRSGALHKILTVYSDDPKMPSKVINLKANIKPVLEFRPTEWFLVNGARVGVETASSVRIVNTGEAPFTIFPPELANGNFKVRFNLKEKQELQPGQEVEITAFVTPSAVGAMSGSIRLKTSTKEYPMKELTVYGDVLALDAPKPIEGAAPVQGTNPIDVTNPAEPSIDLSSKPTK